MALSLASVGQGNTFQQWLTSHNSVIAQAAPATALDGYLQVANASVYVTKTDAVASNNAVKVLIDDRLQVANATALYVTKSDSVASNNAIKVLIDDRLQVANATALYVTKTDAVSSNNNIKSLIDDRLQVANAASLYLPLSGGTVTGSLTVQQSLTVNGDVAFNGNTTIVNQTTIETQDALIRLASNNEFSDTLDIGFFGHFNDGVSNNHTGLIRDSGTKEYYLFSDYKPGFEPTTNIDISHGSFATANLNIASLTGTDATFTGTVNAGNFNSTSDMRLKMNISPIDNALDKVMKLAGVEFDWKNNNQHSVGVIAQQVEQVLPELVETSSNGYKSVSYGNLTALLIEAIKELKTIVDNK